VTAENAEPVDKQETEDPNAATWDVTEWRGKMVVDNEGKKIGRLRDVYVDVEDDEPQFGTISEGHVNRHLTFVPLGGIQVGPDELQANVSREAVRSAPDIDVHGGQLSQDDEASLYHHFELNYTNPDTPSGRRLARR
jgi:hypothetical protein